jgi:hypothetical protein
VYELQPLGTEGQGYAEYPDRVLYNRTAFTWLIGGGFKYRLAKGLGVQLEVGVRKTKTDYLDDVSGTYADPIVLFHEGGEEVAFLADPSVLISGEPVGATGKMRGDDTKKDDYLFAGIGLYYTINPYRCPMQDR